MWKQCCISYWVMWIPHQKFCNSLSLRVISLLYSERSGSGCPSGFSHWSCSGRSGVRTVYSVSRQSDLKFEEEENWWGIGQCQGCAHQGAGTEWGSWSHCWWKACIPYLLSTCYVPGASLQFTSVAQLCPTLWDSMDCSMPGFPVHHQLPEPPQTHVHQVGDAILPSPSLSSPSPPPFNLFWHQGFS